MKKTKCLLLLAAIFSTLTAVADGKIYLVSKVNGGVKVKEKVEGKDTTYQAQADAFVSDGATLYVMDKKNTRPTTITLIDLEGALIYENMQVSEGVKVGKLVQGAKDSAKGMSARFMAYLKRTLLSRDGALLAKEDSRMSTSRGLDSLRRVLADSLGLRTAVKTLPDTTLLPVAQPTTCDSVPATK